MISLISIIIKQIITNVEKIIIHIFLTISMCQIYKYCMQGFLGVIIVFKIVLTIDLTIPCE